MAYTILNPDGTILTTLADGIVDDYSTSLTLIGRNYNSYGEMINNNFVSLLSNFALETEPRSALKGQLWYNTLDGRLKIYDAGFKDLPVVAISSTLPDTVTDGCFWLDSLSPTGELTLVYNGKRYVFVPAEIVDI